jgi:drug/metabolite transporter (DMT)-like permease
VPGSVQRLVALWIPVTLAAATFQVLRTARQHQLRSDLTVAGAGFVRFVYGLPFALAALAGTAVVNGGLPSPPANFWPIAVGAGISQILGTVALLQSFELRNFALGNVYSKTEVVQVALVSALLLDEPLRPLGWLGAAVCMVGVIWLAAGDQVTTIAEGLVDPAAWMGALAGGLFALSAVGIRAASTTMDGPAWPRAIVTLTAMLALQTAINGLLLVLMEPTTPLAVLRVWRLAWIVGVLSLCGSAGWAFAMTLTNAAKVRTLGQVELVIAFAISVLWLREHHARQEYLASGLVVIGIAGVIGLG